MKFFADSITVGEVAVSDYPMITTVSDDGESPVDSLQKGKSNPEVS